MMTVLRFEPYTIPAAEIGPENPLPNFRSSQYDGQIDPAAHNIPPEDTDGLGLATGFRVLPWRIQDGYSRRREPRDLPSFVLENEILRVRVLPGAGGKVADIHHKPLGRELIYRNPVFQPGNLALRNAWTSGGIEWNTSQPGHHYLTCAPIHCARVVGPNGAPVLRLYAWERVKRFPYHLDLYLPPGSPFLLVRIRLINPHDHELPTYWWSNTGMLEAEGGRVITPADTTYHGMTVYDCPVINGLDYSYSTRVRRAYDLFFRIPPDRRPWEVYVDRDGRGYVHTSTRRLRGRKLFAWGMAQGGRRWGEYLAVDNMPYTEIQAGLAYTQYHTARMPAKTEWSWTEAMGYFEADATRLHSEDWQEAYTEAGAVLEQMLPEAELDRTHAALGAVATTAPEEVLFRGHGWAALEQLRAGAAGEDPGIPPELPFDQADLGPDQEPWLQLLRTGVFPHRDPADDPGQFQIQPEWQALLRASLDSGRSDHWLAWLHLGVMAMEGGDTEAASSAWETSQARTPNGWALRNLAVIESRAGNQEAAAELLARAVETGPVVTSLVAEYASNLLGRRQFAVLDALLASIPEDVRRSERLRLAAGWAALHAGRLAEVEEVLAGDFATIREGELTLSELWFGLQEVRVSQAEGVAIDDALKARVRRECPPPYEIDFRMSAEGDDKYVPPQAAGG
jgi:hypothetical protein